MTSGYEDSCGGPGRRNYPGVKSSLKDQLFFFAELMCEGYHYCKWRCERTFWTFSVENLIFSSCAKTQNYLFSVHWYITCDWKALRGVFLPSIGCCHHMSSRRQVEKCPHSMILWRALFTLLHWGVFLRLLEVNSFEEEARSIFRAQYIEFSCRLGVCIDIRLLGTDNFRLRV